MGIALFKIKIMPEGISTDLNETKVHIEESVKKLGGNITEIEEENIAFGLKALIVGIRISEDIDSSRIEDALSSINGVSSLNIIDYRRAIN